MEKRYYTPKIEEFHVGFEFEELTHVTKMWTCESFQNGYSIYYQADERHGGSLNNSIEELINENRVRVKCLDQDDIEELGWDRDLDSSQRYEREDYIMHGFANDGIWAIKERRIYEKHGALLAVFDTLFEGKIKNKSELKRMMVQLGITQEQ